MSNKAIFLDRDDTLIEDAGYINNPDQVKLLDGVGEAMRELKDMGYKLVIATNQSGVARGIVTEEALGEIHNRLKQLLAENGAFLDQIYYCPYHPEGVRSILVHRQQQPGCGGRFASRMQNHLDKSPLAQTTTSIRRSDRRLPSGKYQGGSQHYKKVSSLTYRGSD
jgi:D,D-heptose 1,7-bisphosphate phosphatase